MPSTAREGNQTMAWEEDESATYIVVVNHEEQYSIWLVLFQALPVKACAEVSVTGEPNAVKIEAREASVDCLPR
jgi:hypothetical protein